jgi:hypothetical protein
VQYTVCRPKRLSSSARALRDECCPAKVAPTEEAALIRRAVEKEEKYISVFPPWSVQREYSKFSNEW